MQAAACAGALLTLSCAIHCPPVTRHVGQPIPRLAGNASACRILSLLELLWIMGRVAEAARFTRDSVKGPWQYNMKNLPGYVVLFLPKPCSGTRAPAGGARTRGTPGYLLLGPLPGGC